MIASWMSPSGQKRTNHRRPKSTVVRCYSNSGQTRLRLDCPLSANNGLLHCSRHHPYSITSSTQTSSVSVHTAAAVGIFAHWPYVLTSTSEFEHGQGHREVVQPDQRVRIYSTGERGWEGRFRSHLGG